VHIDDCNAYNRVKEIVTGIVRLSENFVIFGILEGTINYGLPIINHPCMTELINPQSNINLSFAVHIPLVGWLIVLGTQGQGFQMSVVTLVE
jgi:hypothetical protein